MSKILIPSSGAEAWQRFLAEPEKQWRTGYSAKALASCWEGADGFPASVQAVFDGSPFEELHGLEMLLGIPEHRVALPGGRRASQTDLFRARPLPRRARGDRRRGEGGRAVRTRSSASGWRRCLRPSRENRTSPERRQAGAARFPLLEPWARGRRRSRGSLPACAPDRLGARRGAPGLPAATP